MKSHITRINRFPDSQSTASWVIRSLPLLINFESYSQRIWVKWATTSFSRLWWNACLMLSRRWLTLHMQKKCCERPVLGTENHGTVSGQPSRYWPWSLSLGFYSMGLGAVKCMWLILWSAGSTLYLNFKHK